MDIARGVPLSNALRHLRVAGYNVGTDKMQRLRGFGIESSRVGRGYVLSSSTYECLTFLLAVEKSLRLERNHDALALELAFRGYPVIPWDRVHAAAQKHVERLLALVNRELHRFNDRYGSGFHSRRIPHLAKQLARHYIPPQAVRGFPARLGLRETLERAFALILRVVYCGEGFTSIEVQKVLDDFGFETQAAQQLAAMVAPLLHEIQPFLLLNGQNSFLSAIREPADESDVRATVAFMNNLASLIEGIDSALGTQWASTLLSSRYPEVPSPAPAFPKTVVFAHALFYSTAFLLRADPQTSQELSLYSAGGRLVSTKL